MRSARPWSRPCNSTRACSVPAVKITRVPRPKLRSIGPWETSVCCTRERGTLMTRRQTTPFAISMPFSVHAIRRVAVDDDRPLVRQPAQPRRRRRPHDSQQHGLHPERNGREKRHQHQCDELRQRQTAKHDPPAKAVDRDGARIEMVHDAVSDGRRRRLHFRWFDGHGFDAV